MNQNVCLLTDNEKCDFLADLNTHTGYSGHSLPFWGFFIGYEKYTLQ